MSSFHTSVLLQEVITLLRVAKGKKYIDATVGGGGHTFEILKRGGVVLGIDVDQSAIDHVKKILRDKDIKMLREGQDRSLNISISEYPNIILIRGNFRDIDTIAHSKGFDKVAGILFDLGVSSHQLKSGCRGFSFMHDVPLDMRMDTRLTVKAADLVNALHEGELYDLIHSLGEEHFASPIAFAIIRARAVKPIETTGELARIVREAYRGRRGKIDPATKVFQALRIAVNDELNNLSVVLPKSVTLLERGGRLTVVSFHSLEDRIVKEQFLQFQQMALGTVLTKKPIVPGSEEIAQNKKSRSAKLRVFEKA